MWLLFAAGSAFFAGVTAVLAKCGIRKTDSTVATAIRTIVVLAFAWLMVFVVGSQDQIRDIDGKTLLFLVLSGLATGASWLCYFKALQLGDINKVVPIDKSSTILAILLSQTADTTLFLASYIPNFSFPDTLIAYLVDGGWRDLISGSLWGLLAAGAGLAVIVKQITIYTHEPWFLRRNKGRKNR
mgnify:CR=1 FL=1